MMASTGHSDIQGTPGRSLDTPDEQSNQIEKEPSDFEDRALVAEAHDAHDLLISQDHRQKHERAYRHLQKGPACERCRRNKQKCDATDTSSCSTCLASKVKCRFTGGMSRKMSSVKQVEDLEEKLQATRDQISKLESLVKVDDAGVEGPDVGSDHNGYGNFTLQKTSEKTPHTKPARPVPGRTRSTGMTILTADESDPTSFTAAIEPLHKPKLKTEHTNSGHDLPATFGTTKKWLIEGPNDVKDASLGLSEELYFSILAILEHLWKHRTEYGNHDCKLGSILPSLILWGRGLQNEKLSLILSRADRLQRAVLLLLRRIGHAVYSETGCLLKRLEKHPYADLDDQLHDLLSLLDRSTLVYPDEPLNTSLYDEKESFHDAEDCSESREQDSSRGDSLLRSQLRAENLPNEGELESSDPDSDEEDQFDTIKASVDDLMDLLPSLEQVSARMQQQQHSSSHIDLTFSVSEPALPFVRNLADRFKNAPISLLERLGESNWQRFLAIRARRDQAFKTRDAGNEVPVLSDNAIYKDGVLPKSIFHDSGIGSSLYEPSAASHTSFQSSLADDENGEYRVPKTPAAVSFGKPFTCEICGMRLNNISNRVAWKMHVFKDLQPYICTFSLCEQHLVRFSTRTQWADHEFSKHRVQSSWCCPVCQISIPTIDSLREHICGSHPTLPQEFQRDDSLALYRSVGQVPIEEQPCPMCLTIPGRSRRHFVKHVAKHMESIALAVLPQDTNEDSNSEVASEDGRSSESRLAASIDLLLQQDDQLQAAKSASKCNLCNKHPQGFRGEHELRRHIERVHTFPRKVWICVDASPEQTTLANCKPCSRRKAYGAYYNAAAHLRRVHFNPKQKGRTGKDASDCPPIEELKKNWMKELEESVEDTGNDLYDSDSELTEESQKEIGPSVSRKDGNKTSYHFSDFAMGSVSHNVCVLPPQLWEAEQSPPTAHLESEYMPNASYGI